MFRGSVIVRQALLFLGMDVLGIVDHDIRGKWTDGEMMSRAAGPVGLFLGGPTGIPFQS